MTLVELLTVIGIIAVLAAILFPVLSRARESARKARCLSNMQQLGTAIEVYVQDNHGYLPPWSISHPGVAPTWGPPPDPDNPDPSVVTWDISIMYALKSPELLICPDNPNQNFRTARSYAIAQYTQRPMVIGGRTVAIGGYRDDIPVPQETVLLFEKGNNPAGAWGDALGQSVYQSHGPEYKPDEMWHFNGKNFLFVDYHAKWYAKTQGPFAHAQTPDHSGSEGWENQPGLCCDWGKPTETNLAGFQGDWPMP